MSQPSSPGSGDAGLRALVAAWASRPPAETAAFLDTLKSLSTIDQPGLAQAAMASSVDRVRGRAAVSGAIRPADLVVDEPEPSRRTELLGDLADEFDRAVVDGTMTWTLRSQPRVRSLRTLFATAGLDEALDRARDLETDTAGEVLRRLLAHLSPQAPRPGMPPLPGEPPRIATPLPPAVVAAASYADVSQALRWASAVAEVSAPLAWATCRAHIEAIRDSYSTLLTNGVVGRGRQLQEIETFLSDANAWGPVPLLTLTGIGGSGKSTLLARLLLPRIDAHLGGETAPTVIVIDLDRVAFRPHAEAELSLEVTRQLELAWPALAPGLAEIRESELRARLDRRELARGNSPDVERSVRSSSGIEYRVGQLVEQGARSQEPVVLVLDTFEEWQRARPFAGPRNSWNDPEPVMAEWLYKLRYSMGLAGLRVVVSGRAPIAAVPGQTVELGDLDASAADELLHRLGVDAATSPRLAALVGGNPLSLNVAARFVNRLSAPEREDFLAGGGIDSALDEELRRAVLYDRFLRHIADDQVRQLAHPGLTLRRVTPQLVREVLAEPCGFADLSEYDAEQLVDRLADEVWLVRPAPDGSLQHQPDVRRAMLALMADDPALRDSVRTIHQLAAQWYNPSPDLAEPVTLETVEAFYHRMMLESGDPPVVEPTEVPYSSDDAAAHRRAERDHTVRFARELGESVRELAPAVEAQLRLVRGEPLTPTQAGLLPEYLWYDLVIERGAAMLEVGDAEDALDLYRLRPWSRYRGLPYWIPRAYCESAQWTAYTSEVPGLPLSGRYDIVNSLVSDEAGARSTLSTMRLFGGSDGAEAYMRTFGSALARASLGSDLGELEPPWGVGEVPALPHFAVDQLRQYVVGRLTRAPLGIHHGDTAAVLDVAGLFVPDAGVMLGFAEVLPFAAGDLQEISRELLTLADTARRARPGHAHGPLAHEILGARSADVARRLRGRLRLVDGRLSDATLVALRGDNPELRPAIRHELQRTSPSETWLRTLGEIVTEILPIPPVDLRPDALPLMSDPRARTSLVTLVEYADRSRCTRRLLETARELHPEPVQLDPLVRAFNRWDDAHARLLPELARRPT